MKKMTIGQRVSRGVDFVGGDMWDTDGGPNLIIECMPLPLKPRAKLYKEGMDVIIPSVRRVPTESLSPRVKTHNYLNLIMGDLEAKAQNPDAWAILLDNRGFITEGIGSNFFSVKNGVIYTPSGSMYWEVYLEKLPLNSKKLDIPLVIKDIDIYEALTADEIFLLNFIMYLCFYNTR